MNPEEATIATEPEVEEKKKRRRKYRLALCLSGGGFRAALFHLGALRRLHELGVLDRVDVISSVSGGSILAAFLADRIIYCPGGWSDWERNVAQPFRDITRRNFRTAPVASRLLPWNWFQSDYAVRHLAQLYYRYVTNLPLRELPQTPQFLFCATDLAFGVNWMFAQEECGDYQAGYLKTPPDWTVAMATAASSCFPPVFNPLILSLSAKEMRRGKGKQRPDYAELLAGLRLSDGGVYDNMGLEPVWKSCEAMLVSDGGSPFSFVPDGGLPSRLMRYLSVSNNQARAIRKRWLMAQFGEAFEGCYWGLNGRNSGYSAPGRPKRADGYSAEVVEDIISTIRTDLNPFSEAENAVLQNHAYYLADAALQRHAAPLIVMQAPLQPPYPDWMDERRVRRAFGKDGE